MATQARGAQRPMEAPPDAPAAPERVGRYLVFRPFAMGGMASVHLGRLVGPSGFSRLVAIKRLHPLFAQSDVHYRMLLEEARITSRIDHPNAVPILDVVLEEGHLCLVMQYVAGVSLADLLARSDEGGLPPGIAVAILVDLLRGLQAAHEATSEDGVPLGIVHRDVSPHNVLVGVDGVARVLDFGVAKALRRESLTISGQVKGKLSYMSPEQLRETGVTRQSDVYACGAVLWESLTGKRLFGDGDPAAVVARVLRGATEAPSSRNPRVSRPLDAIAARALASEPRGRFATAEEMAIALLDACPPATREEVARFVEYTAADELDRRAALAREAEGYRAVEASMSGPRAADAAGERHLRSRPRRVIALLVAGAALGALGITALHVSRAGSGPTAPSTTALGTEPLTSASASTAPIAEAPLPPAPPLAPPTVEVPSAPTRQPPSRPRGTAVLPGCDPNYSIDADGRKHYKPRCFPR